MEAKHSDDQIGRARVQNTPELEAYYNELEQLGAGALWTVANDIEPWEPRSSSVPMLWKYADLRELVLKSSELVTPCLRSAVSTGSGRRVPPLRTSRSQLFVVGLPHGRVPTEPRPAHRLGARHRSVGGQLHRLPCRPRTATLGAPFGPCARRRRVPRALNCAP